MKIIIEVEKFDLFGQSVRRNSPGNTPKDRVKGNIETVIQNVQYYTRTTMREYAEKWYTALRLDAEKRRS